MDIYNQRRRHSIIDRLDEDVKATVDQMLQANFTYAEIVDYIKRTGTDISIAAVCRYAKSFNASIQALRAVQENFRGMMEEIARYPQLDTTEGILRILSHQMLEQIQKMPEEAWASMKPEDVFRQATALARAVAYKQKTDLANKSILEAGFEQVKTLVFEAMAKENPKLYEQVRQYLDSKKESEP
jgi:hypothetical protein